MQIDIEFFIQNYDYKYYYKNKMIKFFRFVFGGEGIDFYKFW